MEELINLGECIYIPSEDKEYSVVNIGKEQVVLVNFASHNIIKLEYDIVLEIKKLKNLDLSGHNLYVDFI